MKNTKINYYLLSVLLLCELFSVAQTKDSSWQISAGINISRDYYRLFTDEKYKLTNKPSYSTFISGRITKLVGKKKKIGFLLEPTIGISRVVFRAIIPNTDFNNMADSVDSWYYHPFFYRKGILLPQEMYTYKRDYWIFGLNLGLYFKISKRIGASLRCGVLHRKFYQKNYPDFNLTLFYPGLSANHVYHVDILNFYENNTQITSGANIEFKLNEKLKINFLATYRFKTQSYVYFLFDGPPPSFGPCPSFAIGLNYNIKN